MTVRGDPDREAARGGGDTVTQGGNPGLPSERGFLGVLTPPSDVATATTFTDLP